MLNFDWLAFLSPEEAKWVFLGLFILIGVLVWRVPDAHVYAGVSNSKWWHNLKGWATCVLVMISVIYYIF